MSDAVPPPRIGKFAPGERMGMGKPVKPARKAPVRKPRGRGAVPDMAKPGLINQ